MGASRAFVRIDAETLRDPTKCLLEFGKSGWTGRTFTEAGFQVPMPLIVVVVRRLQANQHTNQHVAMQDEDAILLASIDRNPKRLKR